MVAISSNKKKVNNAEISSCQMFYNFNCIKWGWDFRNTNKCEPSPKRLKSTELNKLNVKKLTFVRNSAMLVRWSPKKRQYAIHDLYNYKCQGIISTIGHLSWVCFMISFEPVTGKHLIATDPWGFVNPRRTHPNPPLPRKPLIPRTPKIWSLEIYVAIWK